MEFGAGGRRGESAAPPDDSTLVPAATGLKALGLTLEPSREPFDVLVIDHVERIPTEN